MEMQNKVAVVTGGSRGFGRAIAEALAERGATTVSLARHSAGVVHPGITEVAGDATDETVLDTVFSAHRPDILVLNAGLAPAMAPAPQQSWEGFSAAWNNDLKHSFLWSQKAVSAPMKRGGTVLVVSSGAAIQGSPLSGGYAGAKRMQWLLSNYYRQVSERMGLGVRFCALVPRAISVDTALGQGAAAAYAKARGISLDAFLAGMGPRLTPAMVGAAVLSILDGSVADAAAYAVSGQGLEILENG